MTAAGTAAGLVLRRLPSTERSLLAIVLQIYMQSRGAAEFRQLAG
jgi:hypothetical protein